MMMHRTAAEVLVPTQAYIAMHSSANDYSF